MRLCNLLLSSSCILCYSCLLCPCQSMSYMKSARCLLLTTSRFRHRAACDMRQGSYASVTYLFGFLDSSVGAGFPVLFMSDCFSGPIKLLLHLITAKFIHVQHNGKCHLHYITFNQQYREKAAVAAFSTTVRQSRTRDSYPLQQL